MEGKRETERGTNVDPWVNVNKIIYTYLQILACYTNKTVTKLLSLKDL